MARTRLFAAVVSQFLFVASIAADTASTLRGDANGDGTITRADADYVADFLLAQGPASLRTCLADADLDRHPTPLDVFFLANHLFDAGPQPQQLTETCNGADDDCDGVIDDGLTGCVLMPFGQPPPIAQIDLSQTPIVRSVDAYLLIDRSGSMNAEKTAIKSQFSAVATSVACPPSGTGTPGQCFEDPWFGAGVIGYAGTGGEAYRHTVDVQPSASLSSVPTNEPGGCCDETVHTALYSTITGTGVPAAGCVIASVTPARTSCVGSPASNAGIATVGYPCFRQSAMRYIFLFTDEAPSTGNRCPSLPAVVVPAALTAEIRVVGLYGATAAATELQSLATSTGAVDANLQPLAFSAIDAAAPAGLQNALVAIASGTVQDVSGVVEDVPGDSVDAKQAFVHHIETYAPGTADCSAAFTTADRDGDSWTETYVSARTGTRMCWRLAVKQNTSVAAAQDTRTYDAIVKLVAPRGQVLDQRRITFVVAGLSD